MSEAESAPALAAGERSGEELARVLDSSARALLERGASEGVEHALEQVVRGALRSVPHVDEAGVSLVPQRGTVESCSPSSPAVRELDELQNELGEGPCVDAIAHEQRIVIEDMAGDDRWPRFAAAARTRGFGSLMAFQLFAEHGSTGALNLYASRPRVFDQGSADIGALFAAQAALVLAGARRVSGLSVALESRDVIGQAKGILMERFGVGPQQAFAMLVESSQQTNLKLVDVATWLAGEVAGRGPGRAQRS